jgi:hypothetical protein
MDLQVYKDLLANVEKLEHHYKDMQAKQLRDPFRYDCDCAGIDESFTCRTLSLPFRRADFSCFRFFRRPYVVFKSGQGV